MLRLLAVAALVLAPSAHACGPYIPGPDQAGLAWVTPRKAGTASYLAGTRAVIGLWSGRKGLWHGSLSGARWNDGRVAKRWMSDLTIREPRGITRKMLAARVVVLAPIEGSKEMELVAYTARVKGFEGTWFQRDIRKVYSAYCSTGLLGTYPHRDALKEHLAALPKAVGEGRRQLIMGLGQLGRAASARAALTGLLARADKRERMLVLRSLRHAPGPADARTAAVLAAVSTADADADVRKTAAALLVRLKSKK